MNKKQQELFVAFFEEVFEGQQAFQQIKKKMKACAQYNPTQLFSLISLGERIIEISRMRDYLNDKITCNERELYQLFEKFDISRNGFISQQDFIRQITPLDQQIAPLKSAGSATPQIQGYFLSLIMEYIKRFRILQVARKQIYFIQPYNAFIEIDNFKTGLVGLGELQRFMEKNDYNISEYQLILLLHGLRRRCFLQINLEVFCQNLQPLQFGYYEEYQANVDKDKETQFLKRSRRQEETMRRSRIQSRKIQHNIAKEERRKKADLDRQLDLQQRINSEIIQHEKQKQRFIRRAILQQDKNIRWNVQTGGHALEAEKQRHLIDRLRNQQLYTIKNQENDIQNVLVRSALRRQEDIQNSRRVRLNLERQKQIQKQLQIQQQYQRRQREIARERVLREDVQRQRELQRKQLLVRQRALRQEAEIARQNERRQWLSSVQNSRRLYEQQLRLQRDRAQRVYELDRIRNLELGNVRSYETASNSRRVADLQRQLQKTRLQMKERQSRLNLTQSKRQPETAERSYLGYRS